MVAFILALAALIASFSIACHIFGLEEVAKASRAFYRELKHISGNVVRRGWRPYIPWCFGFILTAIGYRLLNGLPLPDSVTLGVLLGPLGAITAHAVQVRSGDYRAGVANSGGLVNNDALQASA